MALSGVAASDHGIDDHVKPLRIPTPQRNRWLTAGEDSIIKYILFLSNRGTVQEMLEIPKP